MRLEEATNIVIIVPIDDSKVDEVEEKTIKEQIETQYNNYAKSQEELISINKVKAKFDAKNMGFFYSRVY
ncbi:MAG: hypothetical protein ACFFBV_12150 [Promethearchaeota archaeon]